MNHGEAPLESAVLSFRAPISYGYCGIGALTIIATDLELAQGDTVAIPFLNVHLSQGPLQPGDSFNNTLCVTGLAPNRKIDRQPADNTGCAIAQATVGWAESWIRPVWSIHPNPFGDRITLIPPIDAYGKVHFTLVDTHGRTVFDQWTVVTADEAVVLEIPGLMNGIYLLRTIGEERIWSQILVKSSP